MKTTWLLFFAVVIFISTKSFSQHVYTELSGGYAIAGLPALYNPDVFPSIELKAGWICKNPKWQFEAGFHRVLSPGGVNDMIEFVSCMPVTVRYNLPFMFLRAGYASLFWKKNEIAYSSYPYYYLTPSDKWRYSPAFTFAFGLEKSISEQWKINMQVNLIQSLDSWDGYTDYRSAPFSDRGFLVGIQYHFHSFSKKA